jgi:tetratricopeptide (TPR) repeat protein
LVAVRIFLSFNSKDTASAEAIRAGLSRIEPDVQIFFSPISLGAGFWLPKLAEEIDRAEAFLLLIGPNGIGPWQEVEYFTAFDRHVTDKRLAMVPVMVSGAEAPGLSFLRTLNWVEARVITEDKVLHRLLAALKGVSVASTTPLWKLVNPYRGLEAMTESNADYFYGRSRETAAVLTALVDKSGRCPILIGASGVGKSSVAQAGVLSALKSMRWPGADPAVASSWPQALRNSRAWVRLTTRPGEAPLEALAEAMIRLWQLDAKDPQQAALPRKWANGLSAGDNTLADLIGATQEELRKREGEAPEHILIYIDQAEELYTRASQKDAKRFSEVLVEGLGDRRLCAFASMRSDYFGRLQADEPLFRCYEHVDVPPLDRARLHEIVTAPAHALDVTFEDDQTANRIAPAAASEPGALPLLSYLLTDMWAGMVKRGDATLRLPAGAIDVGGVLASRAEEFLKGHPEEEKALRRLLTLKLASVPPEGEPVRRQTTEQECTDAEWALARRLAEHPWRLVVVGERGVERRIVAEVAHEALLRAWPRLSDWLRQERDFLIFKGDAERAERRWREMDSTDAALLTGLDLTRAEAWLPRSEDLTGEVVNFMQRSITTDRDANERQLHEKQLQLRFQRYVSVAAVVAALFATGVGIWAYGEKQTAVVAEQHAFAMRDSFKLAERTVEGLVFDIAQGLRDVEGLRSETVGKILGTAQATVDALLTADARVGSAPENLELQRIRTVMLNEFGDTYLRRGGLAETLKSYRNGLAIAQRLAKADPADTGWQDDLSVSYAKIGDVSRAQGDLGEALKSYRDSLAILERLVNTHPGNTQWQRGLSVSYSRVGDVLVAQENLQEALKSYRDSLAIRERLANSDPGNTQWQRDLSVSYEKIGDVLEKRRDLGEALKSYRDSLAIRERLAKVDPANTRWQRDLSVSYDKIGKVLMDQGDLTEASRSYRGSLAIFERLAKIDPSNTQWQSELSWSYMKVGDVFRAQNNLGEALKSYRDSLAILAAGDPRNLQRQRDLQSWAEKVGALAYLFVLARDFAKGLECVDQAISIAPEKIWLYANRAHTLMFLGRREEARALYLQYRGARTAYDDKSWETILFDDFAELRKSGLTSPLMDEIEKLLVAKT